MTARARYVIGVDLGTTNSAAAFADLEEVSSGGDPRVRTFAIPQLVREGEIEARETLPSFLYLATSEERATGHLAVPWAAPDAPIAGALARDRGALVPSRLVASAKSWLANDAVDRRAPILPWTSEAVERRVSPVEASTRYLAHVRDAWNHLRASDTPSRFERQAIVLTVPASFDEEARELTVEAARNAGYENLTLIEEPSAALHAWIGSHGGRVADHLRDGDVVLVCDVGGGTTDFTLVAVRASERSLAFERVRVGEHLLLGGDNVDLALARLVEEQLGRPRLTISQQQALRRECAMVKEQLLGPPPVDRAVVTLLGSGRSVVGGALRVELSRDEALRTVVDGFLPHVDRETRVDTDRRVALRELSLPYASDPAITRHLAAFLRDTEGRLTRPDVVLFNGGFFTPPETRQRVVDVMRSWMDGAADRWAPRVLANRSPATAVAEGAAHYGLARHGYGIRIGGGSPRAYFIGLRADSSPVAAVSEPGRAVCVLPRGTAEDSTLELPGSSFSVGTNQPLAFTLWSSLTRQDALGEIVAVAPESFHRHSPLVTELRFGKRSRRVELPVVVQVRYTELGTLEIWFASRDTGHRWRLQFALRGSARAVGDDMTSQAEAEAAVEPAALAAGIELVRNVFAPETRTDAAPVDPDALTASLEAVLGLGRQTWPMAVVRPLSDALLAVAAGRRRSARHEARFLNLLGYCLRPGFGATRDDSRMNEARKLFLAGLAFSNDVQCQAEWLVLWQRVAGGLTPGQQQDLYHRHAPLAGLTAKAAKRLPAQVDIETWKLLASLEHLAAGTRTAIGDALLARVRKEPRQGGLVWALARVGSRVPFYGPLNTVVPAAAAAGWIEALLGPSRGIPHVAAAIVQIGVMTGDAARDVDENVRRMAYARLVESGIASDQAGRLLRPVGQGRAETQQLYGESLPEGLKLGEEGVKHGA